MGNLISFQRLNMSKKTAWRIFTRRSMLYLLDFLTLGHPKNKSPKNRQLCLKIVRVILPMNNRRQLLHKREKTQSQDLQLRITLKPRVTRVQVKWTVVLHNKQEQIVE